MLRVIQNEEGGFELFFLIYTIKECYRAKCICCPPPTTQKPILDRPSKV